MDTYMGLVRECKEVQTKLGKCTDLSFWILVYSLKIICHFGRKVVYFPIITDHLMYMIFRLYTKIQKENFVIFPNLVCI